MDNKTAAIWNLVVSLFFAGLMILASIFIDEQWKDTAVFCLIAVWWIPFSIFIGRSTCSRPCGSNLPYPKGSDGKS